MSRRIAPLLPLVVAGCFSGGFDYSGLACESDADCGGLECVDEVCGETGTGTTGSGSGDDGGTTSATSGSGSGGTATGTGSSSTGATGSTSGTTDTQTTGTATTGSTSGTTDTQTTGTGTTGTTTTGTTSTTTTEPIEPNIVFLTSTEVKPGEIGGLTGADATCNSLAVGAGLGGNYVAWLSSTSIHAKDRLTGARGWVRPDGLAFADQASDVAAGHIWYPARIDENGVDRSNAQVITGTNQLGETALGTCGNWSDVTSLDNLLRGDADAGHRRWTSNGGAACNEDLRMYCFGVDVSVPVSITPVAGRLAFVSSDPFIPGGGIGAADTQCQNEAIGAGIGGSFKALMATDIDSGTDRFNVPGLAWVRPDGLPLTLDPTAIRDGFELEAPLYQKIDGGFVGDRMVWNGAGLPNGVSPGSTCGDWGVTAGNAWVGQVSRTSASWYGATNAHPCSDTNTYLYCFQD